MPSTTSALASLFHFGAKTWRPKTAEQSYLELEKKRHAEKVERKQSEVQRKIELLEHIRKLEAKTQALNKMALSAEIETKEHELAMRWRQMVESRQVELAKLELAKRMGQESLDEADLSRIRRERMKAELLAHASNNHAMNEINRTAGHSEVDNPIVSHMPQPPTFVPLERFMSPHPGHTPMAGPIPIGLTSMPGSYGSMPRPDPRFMPMSTPGHMHMPPGGPHWTFDFHGNLPNGPPLYPRRNSFQTYPSDFDRGPGDFSRGPGDFGRGPGDFGRGPGDFSRGPGQFDRGPGDFERGGRCPSRNMYYESDRGLFDQRYPSNQGFFDPYEPIETRMALRAQAERLWRKKLENLDQKARQHNLNAQALREMRKRDLIASLRERGAQKREIEAQAARLAEHDHHLNESQLRELRDKEYLLMLKAKGLQEREIAEQLRRREESDREIFQKELQGLERELRRKEILEAEWAIRRALEKGEAAPLGVTRPSIEEIKREGLLDDFMDGFHELNPRLQHEIISMSAHHRPRSRRSSMNETSQSRPTPGNSRSGGRTGDYEAVSRSSSRHRNSRESSGPDQVRHPPSHRPSLHSLAAEDFDLHLQCNQPGPSNEYVRASRNETSLHDATLAARLQSAAVNSEINGGRSRPSSRASQAPDDLFPSSCRCDPNLLNLRGESRSRSSTCFETRPESRSNNENYRHPGIGRSPLGSNDESRTDDYARKTTNSRPQSRAHESRNLYDQPHGLTQEELSHLSTEEIEMLLAGYGLEPSIYQNVINTKNLSPEEIERMTAEEFDAMLAQYQPSYSNAGLSNLNAGMSNLNVGSSPSHGMGALSRHTSVSGTHSSSSPHRQSSLGRVPSDSSRSLSREGTSSNYQSVSNHQDSRSTSRPTTSLDRSNDRPPSASRSPHRNSGQQSLAGDHRDDNSYRGGGSRNSIYDSPNHQAEGNIVEDDFMVTEMKEQPGATIVKRFGKIQANSRRNFNNSQQINVEQAGLSQRDEMHQAVNNLIAQASRSGANGIVSLRIHDLEDGSYDASGEAVLLMQH